MNWRQEFSRHVSGNGGLAGSIIPLLYCPHPELLFCSCVYAVPMGIVKGQGHACDSRPSMYVHIELTHTICFHGDGGYSLKSFCVQLEKGAWQLAVLQPRRNTRSLVTPMHPGNHAPPSTCVEMRPNYVRSRWT